MNHPAPLTPDRLRAAYEKAKRELLVQRVPEGHWIGELSTSALSTATAVSALALVRRHQASETTAPPDRFDPAMLERRIREGARWLATHVNADGGWGDTDKSHSNISTTMLGVAALHLAGEAANHPELLARADQYIDAQGRVAGLRRRYGVDKTFAVPILTNAALAGLVPWRDVAPLPFEAACLPQSFYRFLQLPVVSYAIPALVAIGQARYFHRKPWNPLTRAIRAASVARSLHVLRRMQPASGGYLEAIPLTSFVVMSLAATGRADHAVTRDGVRFLLDSVRPDGSWPIDTNLATWNTTLALNALAAGGERIETLGCLDWLLGCQHRDVHPFTGARPGGWGWSDLSGAVPDADDTPGALLTLAQWRSSESCGAADRARIDDAARAGIDWLLGLQNRDGGWPTFCRGWGKLPFDRSGADLTAHVLRAFAAWQPHLHGLDSRDRLAQEIQAASERGFDYLARTQRSDGSWVPLWFGNQDHADEENPVYGTAKVLLAYRDANRADGTEAGRAYRWLLAAQNSDGGWGGGRSVAERTRLPGPSSVEETALAVEALLAAGAHGESEVGMMKGLAWLVEVVERDWHRESWPIGFYFAKLWYYERLYPLTFAVSTLGRACQRRLVDAEPRTRNDVAHASSVRPT